MSDGLQGDERQQPDPPAGRATRAVIAQAPQTRPTWLVILTSLMLMFGSQLLFSALTTLRALHADPPPATSATDRPVQITSPEEALVQQLANVLVDRAHPGAVRAHALARLALALMLFYVVAAVFSFDPKGRTAALLAGWLGIAYHIGNALFFILVVRDGIVALAPSWVELAVKQAGAEAVAGQDLVGLANTLTLIVPVATALGGIAFCVVLLAYFGGRRGRQLYGLDSQTVRLPSHGG